MLAPSIGAGGGVDGGEHLFATADRHRYLHATDAS